MSRLRPLLLAMALLAVACAPTEGSPLPPRPTSTTTATPTTTTIPVTTTTITVDATVNLDCPTEFCIVYNLRRDATWSDGLPVTASDFSHTAELLAASGVPGHDLIRSVEAVDPVTALVALDVPYGAWQSLFPRIHRDGSPQGDLAALESTGPFTFADWQQGEYLVVERNQRWWADRDPLSGQPTGDVMEITFVFIDDLAEMVAALRDGDVDVIAARPDQQAIEALEGIDDVEFAVAPGPFWEHIDFHHDDPMLARPWVREAIALSIDRERILDETVRLVDPSTPALDNTVWMTGTPYYEPHFDVGFDPGQALRVLDQNGCERDEDGIQVCDGTRMSFVWATTDDDPARRVTFELVREDLDTIGIELTAAFVSPSEFVSRDFLFGGPDRWQLINFSWRARQDPAAANPTYYCNGDSLNVTRYCSEQVESLIRATETIVDPAERAALYNRADHLYLEDLAVIPLYQKPVMMAWNAELHGPAHNYTLSSDLWNVGAWSGRNSIVVAIPAEPVTMDPRSPADDGANLILGGLLYGAFGMDPTHLPIPVLVESVDLIGGGG